MKSPKDVFSQYLKNKGIRQSEQREHILGVFLRIERHLTTAELYGIVRKKYPNIGYATVYRAMRTICKAGLAEKIDFGDGATRYEHKYGHEHHDHLICLKCGRFIEAMKPEVEKLQEKMAKEHSFTPIRHKMQIFGICKRCKANNKKR